MADTYTKIVYHVTFSTKRRRPLIHPALRDDLYAYIGGIVRSEGCRLLEIGGVENHVHLLVRLRPTTPVASLVRVVKSCSSGWVRHRERSARFQWQTGYGAFTVGESQLETLRQYVRNQPEHHRRLSFVDEFVQLLECHGIEVDTRYLPH